MELSTSSVWLRKVRNVVLTASGSLPASIFRQSSVYTNTSGTTALVKNFKNHLTYIIALMNTSINVNGTNEPFWKKSSKW